MATNVLLPLSSSSIGRNGVAVSGQSGLRGRQRTKEPSPVSLAGFTGSVTRRGKGEETNRATLKTKPSRRTITQEIDPSRYTDMIYMRPHQFNFMFLGSANCIFGDFQKKKKKINLIKSHNHVTINRATRPLPQ